MSPAEGSACQVGQGWIVERRGWEKRLATKVT
jgi:hypothetical protein